MNSLKRNYFPEIDGLRAFAVIAVIVNHFNNDALPSGFLGVDIFFVISGFVITSSLSRRQSSNFWSFIINFYKRRIKRLLPVLLTYVLITSLLTILFVTFPGKILLTGFSSVFGLSNNYLFLESGDYFGQNLNLNTFTHTWSLGVEEQFYFIFPLILWFTGFAKNNNHSNKLTLILLIVLSTISLISFTYFHEINHSASYFLMPCRFWELSLGSIFFILNKHYISNYSLLKRIPTYPIILCILFLFFLPLEYSLFSTILVVFLTNFLIISFKENSFLFNIFTNKKILYLGLISYSLYIWHWGVITISKWTIGIYWWTIPFQVTLILILSSISYKYLEKYFINLELNKNNRQIIILLLLSPSLVFGLSIIRKFDLISYLGNKEEEFLAKISSPEEGIYIKNNLNPNTKRILVIGDSHAGHFVDLFRDFGKKFEDISINLHESGAGIPKSNSSNKNRIYSNLVESIDYYYPRLKKGDLIFLSNSSRMPTEVRRFNQIINGYNYIIKLVENKGISVVIANQTPNFSVGDYSTCFKYWFRPFKNDKDCYQYMPRDFGLEIANYANNEYKKLSENYNHILIFDAFSSICPSNLKDCTNQYQGKFLYGDADHLSKYGSSFLLKDFINFMEENSLLE